MKKSVVLIGPGRLGQAVANLLQEAGYPIRAVIGRDPARTLAAARFIGNRQAATTDPARAREGELILLALPDDRLAETASLLHRQGYLDPKAILIHFSGLHPAAVLLDEEGAPAQALSLHPLQTFPDPAMGVRLLPGSPFAVEGAAEIVLFGEELVRDIGGVPFRIRSEQKALYHAAACIASNYLITLTALAADLFESCGIGRADALRLLTPLLRGTLNNVTVFGPEGALTGPMARGDVRTIATHLRALAEQPPATIDIYRALGKKTIEIARRKGTLGEKEAEEILKLLGAGC